jgi:hypothetical protein
MTEETRTRIERAAPAQWIERLEIFRERFRLGLMDERRFNEIARAFQLKDDLGHIWMPGATSNQWYRWDRTQWRVATPPSQLSASEMPIAISFAWDRQVPAPSRVETPPAPPSVMPPPRVETPPAPPSAMPPPRVEIPPAPPARVPTRPRPTDLPERGATRSRAKPTDLPR